MKIINKILVFGSLLLLGSSCTNLETIETDSVINKQGTTFVKQNTTDFLKAGYIDLQAYSTQDNIFCMLEHTTDEMIPPTRGTDWGDNGIWRTLHGHNWDPTHAFIRDSWNGLNARVFKMSQLLASDPTPQQKAEAQALRAFNMFHFVDLWGQTPLRDVNLNGDQPTPVLSRSEGFDFVVKELEEALPNLPAGGPGKSLTCTKAMANAMLARCYLNKAVFKSADPAGPYTFDPADMAKVISYCDAVQAEGFGLDSDYFNNFLTSASKEVIFATDQGNISSRYFMTLHYDQKPGGWNGFTTLADFYDSFEASDIRRGKPGPKDGTEEGALPYGFLLGKQYDKSGAEIINSRTKKPLNYTREVPLSGSNSDNGIRVIKYHPVKRGSWVFLRYGDVHLMKAEALLRSGKAAEGLALVNELRTLRGASTLAALDNKAMLAERGRELYWEAIRRTDQVRFGVFNAPYQDMTNTSANTLLFPIPTNSIVSNPNLKQNDGY